jgi:hypothetical protein
MAVSFFREPYKTRTYILWVKCIFLKVNPVVQTTTKFKKNSKMLFLLLSNQNMSLLQISVIS